MLLCGSPPECGHGKGSLAKVKSSLVWLWKALKHTPPLSLHTQLLDCDQDLYKNFPLVISERWQQEVVETIYDAVNADTDKIEARKRAKNKQLGQEEGKRLCGLVTSSASWHRKEHARLGLYVNWKG